MSARALPRVGWLSGAAIAALLVTRGVSAADCVRPTDPGGSQGYDYGSAEVSSFGNERVLVWYVTQGKHAVEPASSRDDGVPDEVALAAEVTSNALAEYAAMGFRQPPSDSLSESCGSNGGDGRLDVYLVAMSGSDGQTVAESGRCTSDSPQQCASFLLAKTKLAESYGSLEVGVRTVLPHETFHAVQNAYDVELDRFWAEGSAQWAAKRLEPTLTDLERNLPAFFSQATRPLDAPVTGVTAGYLYGAAIWPVYLSERYGDDIVRLILEQEGQTKASALAATDVVLQTLQSSLAQELPLFSAWNAATGTRAGVGGYAEAAEYPLVALTELSPVGVTAITSGFSTFFYHAQLSAPLRLSITTDATRNTALFLPLEGGLARVDRVMPLPVDVTGEGIVVVSGITTKKTDAPFTLSLAAPSVAKDSGGCAVSPRRSGAAGALGWLAVMLGFLGARRARRR
ncbi:MAG: MXAN_6640 family putative metalloprotease [Polyangiaceae bacterium]